MPTPRLDMQGHLLCPTCSQDHTHLREAGSYTNQAHRLDVTLTFECESGHTFTVTFHQHRGQTGVEVEL